MTRDRHNLDTRVLFAGARVSWASTAPSSSFAMLLGFSFTLQSTAIAAIRSLPKLSKRFVPCHAHTPWYLSCRLSKDPKDHEQNERRLAKRRQTLPNVAKRHQKTTVKQKSKDIIIWSRIWRPGQTLLRVPLYYPRNWECSQYCCPNCKKEVQHGAT